jgi:hypothetical protein
MLPHMSLNPAKSVFVCQVPGRWNREIRRDQIRNTIRGNREHLERVGSGSDFVDVTSQALGTTVQSRWVWDTAKANS